MRVYTRKTVEERFWPKVNKTESCWLWTGSKTRAGYGEFHGEVWKTIRAHRWLYEKEYGPIPHGLHICHHCDTPACVRPSHMFVGTHLDNMRDCARKGRNSFQKGPQELRGTHCAKGHIYSKENIYTLKDGSHRRCRICTLASNRRSYARAH